MPFYLTVIPKVKHSAMSMPKLAKINVIILFTFAKQKPRTWI